MKTRFRKETIRKLTVKFLNELTPEDISELESFAVRRLGRNCRAGLSAEDIVQKALVAIVRGQAAGTGRRPLANNVVSKETFMNYVRSAINSITEAVYRKREFKFIHEEAQTAGSAEEHPAVVLQSTKSPDEDHALRDLKTELFIRMKKRARPQILSTIEEWERHFFWTTEIPIVKNRKHRYEVKKLAIAILRQIGNIS